MSTLTYTTGFNSTASKTIVNQGFLANDWQANPSGRLTRRGRPRATLGTRNTSLAGRVRGQRLQ